MSENIPFFAYVRRTSPPAASDLVNHVTVKGWGSSHSRHRLPGTTAAFKTVLGRCETEKVGWVHLTLKLLSVLLDERAHSHRLLSSGQPVTVCPDTAMAHTAMLTLDPTRHVRGPW